MPSRPGGVKMRLSALDRQIAKTKGLRRPKECRDKLRQPDKIHGEEYVADFAEAPCAMMQLALSIPECFARTILIKS